MMVNLLYKDGKKFIIVKLKGSKVRVIRDPRINGKIYSIKNLLFKYFSIID